MPHDDPPPTGLSARFAQIIGGLCGLLGYYEARERTAGPFVFLIRALFRSRLGRFAALVARFHAGTLPAPSSPAAPGAGLQRAGAERPWDPMPSNRAWLWNLVPGVAAYVALFESLLADPELAALIAATPQAGRLLRPLWRMMTPDPLPAILQTTPCRRPARAIAAASPAEAEQSPSLRPEPSRRPRGRPREVRAFAYSPGYDPLFST